jgi:hypothetical protein
MSELVIPDLQASVVCEDIRVEMSGMHTLVGVMQAIITPKVPVQLMKLCIWTRWCSGFGRFKQKARLLAPDDSEVICQNEIEFQLQGMETAATNAHLFGGVQFKNFGMHHIEISLENTERLLRYPLLVTRPPERPGAPSPE